LGLYPVFPPDQDLFYHWDWLTAGWYHSKLSYCSVLVCLDHSDLLTLFYPAQVLYRQDMELDVCGSRKVGTICSYRRRLDKVEGSQSLLLVGEGSYVCWMGADSYIDRKQLSLLEAWDSLAC
jgi:hypothetical protein